jgi:predicted protein tyrosine phosphatase
MTDGPWWSTDGGIHRIPLPDVTGELWLCGKHHIGPDVDRVLTHTRASLVVCLTQRHELIDRYPRYVEWLDLHAGGSATWFPIHDLTAPPLAAVRPLYDDLAARLRDGQRIVIHCAAGVGRAGTTAVAVLLLLGMPLDDALAHVRAHRPMAGPEVGSQLDLVRELAAALGAAT